MNESDGYERPAAFGGEHQMVPPAAPFPRTGTADFRGAADAIGVAHPADIPSPAVGTGSEPGGALGAEDSDDLLSPARVHRRRRYYTLGTALGLFIAIVVVCAFIQLPYYRFAPGTLYDTQSLITVTGAPSYQDSGPIDFTTVSSKKISVLEAGLARFDPAIELIDAKLVDGDGTPEQTRQLNLEAMADSKQTAEVLAAHELGYPVDVVGTGAVVKLVESPADRVLRKNDTIVGIDRRPITSADQAVSVLSGHKPGDTITLDVEAPPDLVTKTTPAPRSETVTLGVRSQQEPERPRLGVSLGTRAPAYKLPFQVEIDSKSVAGPSAGLAFTLGIIDVLTPGSLTGNKKVAVTGAIDIGGNVGPIGGIRQKTYLALRQGADLFIVPTEELPEARKYAGTMKVVGVANLKDALAALAANGGSVDVVQQAAAARTQGTTAH